LKSGVVADFGLRSVPSIDTIAGVVGAPVDATAWGLRQLGVDVPQNPAFGSQSVQSVLRKYSDFYGPNGPLWGGGSDKEAPGLKAPDPSVNQSNSVPRMTAPAPAAQSTPGFASWLTNLMPSRQGVVNFASDVLGTPVEGPAALLRRAGVPISWKMAPDSLGGQSMYAGPDVPFSSLWFRNAINNPTLSWGQIRSALQHPSLRSMPGIGGLF
jgi:hypothetical protein